MAIDFKKLMALEKAKMKAEGKEAIRKPEGPLLGIRGCGADECAVWQVNPRLIRQGAGYSLYDDNLRARLIATIDGTQRIGSERLLVLRDCALAEAERYNYPRGVSLQKINGVCNGRATMVAWMDLTNQSADDAADLVLAISSEPAIVNA